MIPISKQTFINNNQQSEKRPENFSLTQSHDKQQEHQRKRDRKDSATNEQNINDPKRIKGKVQGIKRRHDDMSETTVAKKQFTSPEQSALGLKNTLHGNIYQLKLLMLFLKRGLNHGYSFRLATEMSSAAKFDDLVFQYDNKNEIIYRFLQAKHKQDESKKITANDLLTEKEEEFSLQKYFVSYRKIKQYLQITGKNNTIKDFIICTNIDIENSLQNNFENIESEDNILDTMHTKTEHKRLKFKKGDFPKKASLISIFKEASDLKRLAKKLAEYILNINDNNNERNINLKDTLFKKYHGALANEVININSKPTKFKSDFITDSLNLSQQAKQFRHVLREKCKMIDETYFRQLLEEKTLNVSPKFGKVLKLNENIEIDKNFAAKFAEIILTQFKSNNVNVKLQKKAKLFKCSIDKLAGHILVEKDDIIQFRPGFLNDDLLPGSLNDLRDTLKEKLKEEEKFNMLKQFNFTINDFYTCTEDDYKEYEKDKSYFNHILPSDEVTIEEINEFLDKLVLAVNQPNEIELGNIIKDEIGEDFNLIDSELLASNFQQYMLDWMKEKKGHFLTHQDGKAFFNEAKQRISTLILIGPTLDYCAMIKHFGVVFDIELQIITKLKKFLYSKDKFFNVINLHHTVLSSVKIYQTLKVVSDYQRDDSYIFIRLSSLLHISEHVIQVLGVNTAKCLLVIECDSIKENIPICQKLTKFLQFLQLTINKKIIFITQKENIINTYLNWFFPNNLEKEEDNENDFNCLTFESKNKLLDERKVIFQGRELNLGSVIDDTSTHLLDAEVLSKVIMKEKINIGNKLVGLEDVKEYYIERVFNRQIVINQDIEGEKSKFTFVYNTPVIKSSAYKGQDIILISESGNDFEELCERYKNNNHNIHWLEKVKDKLLWRKSLGPILNLRHFVDKRNVSRSKYEIGKLTDISENITIISAEPGMGKSTVLTKLAKETIGLWIIRINLNDCTKKLDTLNSIDKNAAVNFLLDTVNFETPFEKELFKSHVNNKGKVALLFDAFDEIPDYKDKTVLLLKILSKTKVEKIWITTRPHMKSLLEDEFSVFSHSLEPLSLDNQTTFLRKFWCKNLISSSINENRLKRYSEKLLDLFTKSITDKEAKFTGVPLQTRLLAEAFQDEFTKFHNSNKNVPILPKTLSLVDLYERFIDKKFRIYCEEKRKDDLTKSSIKEGYKVLKRNFILQHKQLAFSALFSKTEINQLFSQHIIRHLVTLKKNIIKGTKNTGIINQIINDRPNFIHRTFAEYFVAHWLADKNNIEKQEVKFVLFNQIFKEENQVLRNFFDRILVKDDKQSKNKYNLHVAVLNNDKNHVIRLLTRQHNIINNQDKAGRTALHLASAYGNKDIVEVLLNNDADIKVTDKIFNWTTLSYADNTSQWGVAELLLKKGADNNDMFKAIKEINEYNIKNNKQTLLHLAADMGFIELASFLVAKGANVNAEDDEGITPLHIACKYGQLEVAKLLVTNKALYTKAKGHRYNGYTPIHFATQRGHFSCLKVIQFLVEEIGADFDTIDNYGFTPLMLAAENGNLDTVTYLIKKGANVEIRDHNRNRIFKNGTILHLIASCPYGLNRLSSTNLSKFLSNIIQKGVEINATDFDGNTALNLIINSQYGKGYKISELTAITKAFIENGANVMTMNRNNPTPLDVVVTALLNDVNNIDINQIKKSEEHIEFTRLLRVPESTILEAALNAKLINIIDENNFSEKTKRNIDALLLKGANVNTKNHYNDTPLHIAAVRGNLDLVTYLVNSVNSGAKISAINNYNSTPLHRAVCSSGNLDVVKFLVDEQHADISSKDKDGRIPLHIAALAGRLDIVEYLVNKGSDVEAIDNQNLTSLLLAYYGKLDVVKYLIDRGANINSKDKYNMTLLHLAAGRGDINIVKLLINLKAKTNITNYNGRTPLEVAQAQLSRISSSNLDVYKEVIDILKLAQ